ncbi:MAG TPA: aminomethyl-transferring glycine dehydrogenase subunit GcvPA [Syntrophomonadaceae bacterium]|nr:aminomethyl-transferring glycine dehydrogenase subunit GcvPA [Syntrophomonadaceae bacterium]
MRYTPNPHPVVLEMLESIGYKDINELFTDIPDEIKLNRNLDLADGMSEIEVKRHLTRLANLNISTEDYPSFLGAGAYDHHIPSVIDQLLLRSEFYTSYTPYQPEISQGILKAIFEFQTMMCNLTNMDVANASIYDAGSALAEACNLACLQTKRSKVLVPDNIHPEHIKVLQTYAISEVMEIVILPTKEGRIDINDDNIFQDKDIACVVIQQPNFYGIIENISPVEKLVHDNKSMLIMAVDPISLGILKTPGELNADIAVGEGQSLGNSLSFGGPYLGFFTAKKKYLRKIPGRIVGEAKDIDGKRAFVLTLQAREQHIRRGKASSNICSNQALNALAATMYLALVGPEGLKQVALRSHQLAVYAQRQLASKGILLKYQQPFFREFVIKLDNPGLVNQKLLENGILGGYELPDGLMLAFTEKRTKEEIDKLVAIIGGEN